MLSNETKKRIPGMGMIDGSRRSAFKLQEISLTASQVETLKDYPTTLNKGRITAVRAYNIIHKRNAIDSIKVCWHLFSTDCPAMALFFTDAQFRNILNS